MARMHSERGRWREKAKEKETRNSSHLAQSGRTQGRTVVLPLPMLKRQGDTSSRQALAYTKVYKLDVDVDGPSTIIDKKKKHARNQILQSEGSSSRSSIFDQHALNLSLKVLFTVYTDICVYGAYNLIYI